MAALGSLSKLINKRGRSVIQIIERMPLAIIINPSHQYFSIFSSRNVRLGLDSVLVECGDKAKNPGRSGRTLARTDASGLTANLRPVIPATHGRLLHFTYFQ
jgi:hypothetical protein